MLSKIAILEGSTLLLLLFIAVPAKRLFGYPEAVSVLGPVHGAAFILYVLALSVFLVRKQLNSTQWSLGLLAAFLPFGSFLFERKVLKPQQL
jgi:integral membrane protein